MSAVRRSRQQTTEEWQQLACWCLPRAGGRRAAAAHRAVRPDRPRRARETGMPERTLRRKAARFDDQGMRSLFDGPPRRPTDRRGLPLEIRRAIVALKAEYPPFGLREIAAICRRRFGRPVGHHTVRQVLAAEPLPLEPAAALPALPSDPRPRPAPARGRPPGPRRLERPGDRRLPGHRRTTVYEMLARWDEEGWPGLDDRSLGPRQPARKVDLRAMAAVRRLQANPELGEFRVHAALAQQGIDLSPRTCGRILARHRAMGVPADRPPGAPHEPQPMPFAAARRHQ